MMSENIRCYITLKFGDSFVLSNFLRKGRIQKDKLVLFKLIFFFIISSVFIWDFKGHEDLHVKVVLEAALRLS